jgi:hypothetical protein
VKLNIIHSAALLAAVVACASGPAFAQRNNSNPFGTGGGRNGANPFGTGGGRNGSNVFGRGGGLGANPGVTMPYRGTGPRGVTNQFGDTGARRYTHPSGTGFGAPSGGLGGNGSGPSNGGFGRFGTSDARTGGSFGAPAPRRSNERTSNNAGSGSMPIVRDSRIPVVQSDPRGWVIGRDILPCGHTLAAFEWFNGPQVARCVYGHRFRRNAFGGWSGPF